MKRSGNNTVKRAGASAKPMLRSETGMSLIELIVAGAISALLLGLVATIFAQGIMTQQQQAARDAATGQLNAISSYLNESMRNAVTARTTEANSRIDVKVLNDAGTAYECRSWKITGERLWYNAGNGPRGDWNSGWSVLAGNIVAASSGESSGFTSSGRSISYILSVNDGDAEVTIRDGGYPGAISTLGGSACW